MDTNHNSRCPHGVNLGTGKKITAVYKGGRDDFPCRLPRIRSQQRQKWVKLMAAVASHAVNRLYPLVQRMEVGITLPPPGTGQIEHRIAAVRQIEAQTHGLLQPDSLTPLQTFKPGISGNHRKITVNSITQHQPHADQAVL